MSFVLPLTLSGLSTSAWASGPYTPGDNAAFYPINTLNNPGALFPLGGDIPSARVHHTIVSTLDYLLVYGGYATDGSLLGDINVFHIPSQAWSGPIVRKQCCDAEGENIETIGADVNGNFNVNTELPYLETGHQGDAPLPRSEHSACVIDQDMYLFGGVTDLYSYVNDVYQYHPKAVTWKVQDSSLGTSFPQRRAGHAMVCDSANKVFYVFGGRTAFGSRQNVGLNDIWRYHTDSKKWRLLTRNANTNSASTPAARQHASMLMLNGNLYVFGGIHPTTGVVYSDVWVFHIALQQWELLYNRKKGNAHTDLYATTNTNNTYQFAPPPLYNAHIFPVPASLDPYTNFNTTTYGTAYDKDTHTNAGFLVYGGVGGGGVCGAKMCGATETLLGQVYKFSITEGTWTSPHTTTGVVDTATTTSTAPTTILNDALSEKQYVRSSTWEYARLSTNVNTNTQSGAWVDRGKYIKTFALESVVFDAQRNLMYEIGGMMAVKLDATTNSTTTGSSSTTTASADSVLIAQQQSSTLSTSDVLQSDSLGSSVPPTNTGDHPIFLTPASGALPQAHWDRKTGEQLRERVDAPTNGFWDYSSGFTSGSTSGSQPVVFLRAFRTYTVSPSDIVLIKEDIYEGNR